MTMRRGACPTLLQPMQTGDGLLVRFAPGPGRLTPVRLRAIGQAAEQHGNGLVEITSRGKLQVRGLSAQSAPLLGERIVQLDLGLADGLQAEVGALAGSAADEIADPLPLATTVAQLAADNGLTHALAPKVSVTIDGGGALHLAEIGADIKIEAISGARWRIGIGGNSAKARWLGQGDAAQTARTAIVILGLLANKGAAMRVQHLHGDLLDGLAADLAPTAPLPAFDHPSPVGVFPLRDGSEAYGFALPFGQARGQDLAAFAEAAIDATEIRLAPGGGLLVLGLPEDQAPALRETARRLDFIADPTDTRLSIVACAGAPSCAAALFDAKAVGRDLASSGLLDGSLRVHLAACAKLCAQPAGPKITLIGRKRGCTLAADNATPADALEAFLGERGEAHRTTPRRKKT
ncbi:precorrin-3B synthase [Nitratireductor soli]|uniref:precorrin-3B synthase n=1 Tax=Nitratireductor soli TaxID=1670619 RepID=UPI00065E9AA3|nr:precorrin-3B synthase [Nitratireductor soli]